MQEVKMKGTHYLKITDKKGRLSQAALKIKYKKIRVLLPIDKSLVLLYCSP
jgi:hypothetical protein